MAESVRGEHRRHDHRGVIRHRGERLRRLFHDGLDFVELRAHVRAYDLDLVVAQRRFLHHLIDVEAIRFVRRNASCGGVRLLQITQLFQIRHLVADGSARKIELLMLADRTGTDRRRGHDVLVDDRFENAEFPRIQFHIPPPPFVKSAAREAMQCSLLTLIFVISTLFC